MLPKPTLGTDELSEKPNKLLGGRRVGTGGGGRAKKRGSVPHCDGLSIHLHPGEVDILLFNLCC